MKSVDRIRNYINKQKKLGVIKPGDKLPSFNELMEMFNVSYLTASSAINTLANEGLVEIKRGSGSFLSGANELKILINVQPSTLSFSALEKILNKHLVNANLHIDFEIRNVQDLADPVEALKIGREYKAAISSHPALVNEQELPPSLLTEFPDYKEVMSNLITTDGVSYEYCLPFYFYSHQIGVNRTLLKRTGYSMADLTMDFSWWDGFVKKCREIGIAPASVDYIKHGGLLFQDFLPLLLSWIPYDEEKYEKGEALLNTPEGKRLLKVIKDTELVFSSRNVKDNFFLDGAVLSPCVGSWLTVQNGSPDHPEKMVDDLDFLPYRNPDGQKMNIMTTVCLKSYMRHDISLNERKRVWELMKIMVSREFQMDYCAMTGVVSANKDILPTEHFWNRENKYPDFFPDNGSQVIYPKTIFSMSRIAMLSVLLENFKIYDHDLEETLTRMDVKKRHYSTDAFPES